MIPEDALLNYKVIKISSTFTGSNIKVMYTFMHQ